MSNEAISFGCCENFTDDGTFLGWEPKTLTKTLIGHIIAEEVAEAGMEVASLDSFFTPSQTPTHLSAKLEINVGVSYLSATHRHAVLEGVGELLAVIVLNEGGVDEILVPLVDVFGAAASSGVDGVNDDIEDHLAD